MKHRTTGTSLPRARTLAPAAIVFLALVVSLPAWGGGRKNGGSQGTDAVLHWSRIAIDASGRDHGAAREQFGPGRSSKAMAVVHIAIFDAVNAIEGGYRSYTKLDRVRHSTSMRAAIAQAAHDTLAAQFPSQEALLAEALDGEMDEVPNGLPKMRGIDLGKKAARAILQKRAGDGSDHEEPLMDIDWIPSDQPGRWRQDPVVPIPIAMGAYWSAVKPLVLASADQFRTPPPPAMTSAAYTRAYDEVKRLGGDGLATATQRTPEQTIIGIYWAYDGTPALCAPPRLYNQIAHKIAEGRKLSAVQLARMLALVNVAMADAGIAIWESKYYYDFWRPVTGIRESDPGTGPTGLGDGNPDTFGDVTFTPLGAPASNLEGVLTDFTPPFPAYPSGHAGFGGALFQTLRRFYGTDRIAFTFVSDEFDGVTQDDEGNTRPLIVRSFERLSEAEEENGQSRIYLGIHWEFDKVQGIAQGRRVANHVFDNAFRPLGGNDDDDDDGHGNGGGGGNDDDGGGDDDDDDGHGGRGGGHGR